MREDGSPQKRLTVWRDWRFWLGLFISLICLVWLLLTTDWSEVWQALAKANYWLISLAIILMLVSIPMRTLRWKLLFPESKRPPFSTLMRAMLVGQSVNILVPARLGDLIKAANAGLNIVSGGHQKLAKIPKNAK